MIQCVKLPGSLPEQNEIKEITSDLFDTSRVKDIRCEGGPGGQACCMDLCANAHMHGECVNTLEGRSSLRSVNCEFVIPGRVCAHPWAQASLTPARLLSSTVQRNTLVAHPPHRQTKLRVVLVAPPRPPSPVPEGNEEPNSPLTTKDGEAWAHFRLLSMVHAEYQGRSGKGWHRPVGW